MVKQPAKVNYFFGGAYKTLWRTIYKTFFKCLITIKDAAVECFYATVLFFKAFFHFVASVFTFNFPVIWEATKATVVALWHMTYAIPVFLCVVFFAPALCLSLSAMLLLFFLAVMSLIYITFVTVYLLDLLYRKIKQISNTCSNCQHKIKIPVYICPECGREHTRLIPSKYGIFKRTCICGAKLPTIFLTGREKLDSKCPHCEVELADTTHVDITIPVVGGPSAGKTCYIHMAMADIDKYSYEDHGLEYEYDTSNSTDEYAANMSYLKAGSVPAKTSDMRLRFYRFYLKPKKAFKHLISLCDVGGEIYDDSASLGEQIAFSHVKGIIMVIDPLSIKEYRKELEKQNVNVAQYGPSAKEIDEILTMLITTLENMCGVSSKALLDRDVAIVFSKGDIPGLADKIGRKAVAKYMAKNPESSILEAQNAVCEQFLKDYDEYGFINAVKSKFKVVQYFSCSALGHNEDGSDFTSSGVSEPVYWIIDKISASINLSKIWGGKLPYDEYDDDDSSDSSSSESSEEQDEE